MSLDLLKAENEGFPMRYMTSLYLKYFLRKLPKTVEICLKKSRLPGYFFVGVYVEFEKAINCTCLGIDMKKLYLQKNNHKDASRKDISKLLGASYFNLILYRANVYPCIF